MNDKTVAKGEMALTVLYCAEGLKAPQVLKTNLPFSQIIEMPGITEICECDSTNLAVSSKCEYINCRAVTGRKVDIHGAVSLNIRVFKRCSNQIVSDYDDSNVELKRMIAPATVPIVYREKYLAIE